MRTQLWLQNASSFHCLANSGRLTLVSQSCPSIPFDGQNGNAQKGVGPGSGAPANCRHHSQPPEFIAGNQGEITQMTVKNPVKNWPFDYDICHCFRSLNHFLRALIKRLERYLIQTYI